MDSLETHSDQELRDVAEAAEGNNFMGFDDNKEAKFLLGPSSFAKILQSPDVVTALKQIFETITGPLQSKCKELEKVTAVQKAEISILKKQVYNLQDDFEKSKRASNLMITGLPEGQNENLANTVIDLVQGKLEVDLAPEDIESASRMGKQDSTSQRPRMVFLKLASANKKRQIFMAKRKLFQRNPRQDVQSQDVQNATVVTPNARGPLIFINEDLTRPNQELFRQTRQLKRDGKIHNTWTQDGCILVSKGPLSRPLQVRGSDDLQRRPLRVDGSHKTPGDAWPWFAASWPSLHSRDRSHHCRSRQTTRCWIHPHPTGRF